MAEITEEETALSRTKKLTALDTEITKLLDGFTVPEVLGVLELVKLEISEQRKDIT